MLNFKDIKGIYLIGEVGINHNGDLQIAKRLIDAVFACNWNCAKFQKKDPVIYVPEKQKKKLKDTPWGKMPYIALSIGPVQHWFRHARQGQRWLFLQGISIIP